jgi:hypothetical protein
MNAKSLVYLIKINCLSQRKQRMPRIVNYGYCETLRGQAELKLK